ncbi:putative FlgJ-like protein [Legionella busanensis]|uniref:Putative FlgJ-like protein n=1 Tax=Legionella busanensis TaxID=190655 RepID=A0A378JIU1_9GAMM|nr:hypothetical protein [Legionella busanensis]STX50140.1 putative FlgJ-like protein [Legionella busanensis]
MREKLKLVNAVDTNETEVMLHPDILNILFEHRRQIRNVFLQINGFYDISHFSLSIVDPSNEMIILSATPNIEYNLIQQDLWKFDSCFSPLQLNNNQLFWWNEISQDDSIKSKIEKIKLQNNHFNLGMTLCRQVGDFYFLYSYATKSLEKDLHNYYSANIFNLINIGDYFYNSISFIYTGYNKTHKLPELGALNNKAISRQKLLKLVINNT